jgi:hypothetical protein
MTRKQFRAGLCFCVGFGLVALCLLPQARAQGSLMNAPEPFRAARARVLPGKPSQPPAFALPVQALGFSAPPLPAYLGERNSLVSLDFLDENRLLFTFRAPGLLRREAGEEDVRQIRAVLLALPSGVVEAEALWTVHDRGRYLWMLHDGHFLLRDRNNLQMGDATLELKPYLRFPGPLNYLEMDPSQQFLVTDSTEPEAAAEDPGEPLVEGKKSAPPLSPVIRILRRDSGQVLLVSRSSLAVHLPINADGYLESLRARGGKWLLNLKYFSGGSSILGQVESSCSPVFDFVSQREVLATTCDDFGYRKLVAMGTDGRLLWENRRFSATVWPLRVMGPNGSRLAWESLTVTRPVNASSPLDAEDVYGQRVEVFNAADGKVALDAPASPVFDAGGNVAISPSGRRIAVLNGGQIQVFELPPALPLAEIAVPPPGR